MKLSNKLILPFALSILVIAPASARKPETFLGKIGTSIIQTLGEHPIITGTTLLCLNAKYLPLTPPTENEVPVRHILATIWATMMEVTLFNALSENFEIESLNNK